MFTANNQVRRNGKARASVHARRACQGTGLTSERTNQTRERAK